MFVSDFRLGTYNNQYMVLDLKQIELKKYIGDDALWVVEQIPTLVEGGDQTPILRAGKLLHHESALLHTTQTQLYNHVHCPILG